eukprot:458950_1
MNPNFPHFLKGDRLYEIINEDGKVHRLDTLNACDVYQIIKYQSAPFQLGFKSKECCCCTKHSKKKCNSCCTKHPKKKCNSCLAHYCYLHSDYTNSDKSTNKCEFYIEKCSKSFNSEAEGFKSILIKWFIKILVLSSGIISKYTSVLDTVTDIVLLYQAATNDARIFTILSVICLLSPYILSYSAGVQIFIHRRTFQAVELLTFESLLLGLYLFPCGILYFIFLDIIDIFLELYKWFGYGLTNKIKTVEDVVRIESNVSEYFGMSRMDWKSFKKQK